MNATETLRGLVAAEGMAAVLATLRGLLADEADEVRECGEPADIATADAIEDAASLVLRAAATYNRAVKL